MVPANIRPKRRKTVLSLVLALAVGLPSAAQGSLLDFTVSSINPGVLVSYAGGWPARPPLVGSNLEVTGVRCMGDQGRQLSSTITLHNRIPDIPSGALVDYFFRVPAAPFGWMFGGIPPQGSILPQSVIPCLDVPDGTTLLGGSLRTASVPEPAPGRGKWFCDEAGPIFADHQRDGLLAYSGFHRQAANNNFYPTWVANFALTPGEPVGIVVPSSDTLNHLAQFSSTLLLLGSGLLGLAGLRYRRRRG